MPNYPVLDKLQPKNPKSESYHKIHQKIYHSRNYSGVIQTTTVTNNLCNDILYHENRKKRRPQSQLRQNHTNNHSRKQITLGSE